MVFLLRSFVFCFALQLVNRVVDVTVTSCWVTALDKSGCYYKSYDSFCDFRNAGVPPILEDCQVVNQAQSWFFLECDSIREVDDKSKEFYVLELYNADNGQLLINITSDEPAFQVSVTRVVEK